MRVIVLLSGGIDSPVAAVLASRAGMETVLLHMDNRPFTDDASEAKVAKLHDHLRLKHRIESPLYVAPFGETVLSTVQGLRDRHLKCVHCKRSMLRVANLVALKVGAGAIVTGEALGQVASQTLTNLRVEEAVSELPIIRPLVGLDKEEIMRLASAFGTFDISISHSVPCGLVPDGPCVAASLKRVEGDETPAVEAAIRECASRTV